MEEFREVIMEGEEIEGGVAVGAVPGGEAGAEVESVECVTTDQVLQAIVMRVRRVTNGGGDRTRTCA